MYQMTGTVGKLIIFRSVVNRIVNTGRNERVTLQVYDTCLQMLDVCTPHHRAHIEAVVKFVPYSHQQVRCDDLHSRSTSVLQIRYAHGLWWHKHFVLHITPNEVFTRGYIGGPCRPRTKHQVLMSTPPDPSMRKNIVQTLTNADEKGGEPHPAA